ncbi:MAG TPA: RluA family pseudouridine synthase [Candidatus Scatomorpha intestinigallinarum]|uniref:Pseudouridine synthase n=1 Tax=Candidatus Scatomorpha intestinigallinarum TaxID=2840923 RepID=A0A9D1DMN8_9FIRM|nr:RluA family pseudouridine synthase [Candidatus Scatomorpha intestinigallinarum]
MSEHIEITAEESGERIDALLARLVPELTRSAAQRLLEEGLVTLGGVPVKKNRRTEPGEVYAALLPEPELPEPEPQDIPLDIVYEDADVVVVNKPRGMVVHPAPGHPDGTLVNALLWHCGESLSGVGGERRPGIVHRIDKDTSGLIIAAKNDYAHLALSAQLADRSLSRVYEAVARGEFREEAGTVDAPIGRHPTERKRMAVTERGSRPAVTHWEVIARYRGWTHIRCRLETGRTHQIRVHMAYIGHPLLGDMVYGAKKPERGLEGQCLHARELKFLHPRTGEAIHLSTELPEYFQQVLASLPRP